MSSAAELQRRSLLKQLADRNAQQQQQQQQQTRHHRVLLPPDGETPSISNQLPTTISSLQGVEKDLEHFQNHDIIKGILDHGRHVSDFAHGIEEELQQTERESVQIQSQLMSIKLVSRRTLEQHLGSFIEHLTVPESMVATILDGQPKCRQENVQVCVLARSSSVVCSEDWGLFMQVRDFMLHKVLMLRRPKTNIQIIQQTSLLKNKKFLHFLKQHGHDLYKEGDMLGTTTEHGSTASSVLSLITSGATGRGATGSRPTTEHVFALGNRVEVLEQLDAPAVVPHMADAQGRRFLYQAIFRWVPDAQDRYSLHDAIFRHQVLDA
ncbi:hypothetical protein DUNSADRAFT_5680 [Dunaliella salina]|uniref:Vps52 coiled-coil domain-containing protein n=1 Tax=Dunaliella salina TaxID=3046 RepID=A0ABQ7GPS1_DUNSA|nr:hypothetical protein DUNSADRAFT_5680 [Dunaliella salina]|eukprot:KAF5836606.1 hypothetical protein DUNSADRAFT_5680 [Dunaliella salina]